MGIDYGSGVANVSDVKIEGSVERVRFGVISQNEVIQAWCDESKGYYGAPHCPHCGNEFDETELQDCDNHCDCGGIFDWGSSWGDEPLSHYVDSDGYEAEAGSDGDIFIAKSPYYTVCGFCSPCAPGAGYLTDSGEDCAAFCFGPDWFDGPVPHNIYEVETGRLVCVKGTENVGV